MSFLSRLFGKASPSSFFQFLVPTVAPAFKAQNYVKAYRGWVSGCVSKIAQEVATIEFKLQKKNGDKWEDVPKHPAIDLLARPNPFTLSDTMFEGTSSYIDLVGNSYWYVAYNKLREPRELWPLDPNRIEIKKSASNFIAGYRYQTEPGKFIDLETWEIIHFKTFNPSDQYKGIGVVEQAAIAIDTEQYAAEWNRNFFYNAAIPAGILSTEGSLTGEQFERMREQWDNKYRGVNNAHRTAILEGGLKFQLVSLSQKDMDFLASQKYDRDTILAMFGVPKSIFGLVEDVNRANGDNDTRNFARYTILPRFRFLAAHLTEFYLPMWKLNPSEYRIYYNNPVPQDPKNQLQERQVALTTGYKTRNEVRKEEGLEPVEGGDELLVPRGLTTLAMAIDPPEPVAAPGQEPQPKKTAELDITKATAAAKRTEFLLDAIERGTKATKKIYAKQKQEILKRLSESKALSAKDDNPNDQEAQEASLSRLLFDDWEQWAPIISAAVSAMAHESFDFGGTRTLERSGIDISFDLANPRAVAWLRDRALASSTQINETVKGEIKNRLIEGVQQGRSIDDIAKSIEEFFDKQSQWRALRVARTEVLAAYAQGSLEGARQGNLDEKRWLLSPLHKDSDECDQNASVGWIGREDAFPTGHMAPPIHPNEACDIEFRLKPEG